MWFGEHKTNAYVRDKVYVNVGHQEPLLSVVKRQNLASCGHAHDTLSKSNNSHGNSR